MQRDSTLSNFAVSSANVAHCLKNSFQKKQAFYFEVFVWYVFELFSLDLFPHDVLYLSLELSVLSVEIGCGLVELAPFLNSSWISWTTSRTGGFNTWLILAGGLDSSGQILKQKEFDSLN